jgi:hypothetical protein
MLNWEWNFTKRNNWTQTSFSTNFGGKLSFIPSFLFPERLHCCYIYFHHSYLYNNYNYSRTLNAEFQHLILSFNKISLLCREGIGGERERDFRDDFIIWTKNGYEFSSIERRAIYFFIHLQEGYETFPPLTWGLRGCFQTSKQKVMGGNQLKDTGYRI